MKLYNMILLIKNQQHATFENSPAFDQTYVLNSLAVLSVYEKVVVTKTVQTRLETIVGKHFAALRGGIKYAPVVDRM